MQSSCNNSQRLEMRQRKLTEQAKHASRLMRQRNLHLLHINQIFVLPASPHGSPKNRATWGPVQHQFKIFVPRFCHQTCCSFSSADKTIDSSQQFSLNETEMVEIKVMPDGVELFYVLHGSRDIDAILEKDPKEQMLFCMSRYDFVCIQLNQLFRFDLHTYLLWASAICI